jgi:hypothetical protein
LARRRELRRRAGDRCDVDHRSPADPSCAAEPIASSARSIRFRSNAPRQSSPWRPGRCPAIGEQGERQYHSRYSRSCRSDRCPRKRAYGMHQDFYPWSPIRSTPCQT